MDYKKINVPLLSNSDIKNRADSFRKRFWNDTIVPIDIESIVELKLKMDIIPKHDLYKLCDVDALVTSNWKSVYVDYYRFIENKYKNRLRFSFAHEIGHFVLHRDIYNSLNIKKSKDFYRFFKEIPQKEYDYFENQANKFANYLLVPRERLIYEKSGMSSEFVEPNSFKTIDDNTLNSYLAIPISKVFGVSEQVIEIALSELSDCK